MTDDQIIAAARLVRDGGHWNQIDIINFGRLIALAEREACVQEIREVRECIWDGLDGVIKETARNVCDNMIIRINARGRQ